MSENSPKILIVSDMHLGALRSEMDLFNQFLKGIIDGDFGNDLHALIILGDFLDLCTSVPKTLLKNEKIQEIFTLLLKIKKKLNLIFVLGNHEIPITGDYDEKFKRRKKKFLSKFKYGNFDELFNEEVFCQYIILKKLNNKDMLLLYDSRDQIPNTPISKIIINGLDLQDNFFCLMTHGYQFDGDMFRFFEGILWKSLISSDKYDVKECFDYFWNEIIKSGKKIKSITFDYMKKDLARLNNMSLESIDMLFSELSGLEYNFIKLNMRMMMKWHHTREYEYFIKGIKDFLKDDNYDFQKITHIIYSHSHIKGISKETVNDHLVSIINSGAWQHTKPSYVEILNKGGINLMDI